MIKKTKDKREQADLMIAAATRLQEANGGKLPSATELASELNTSAWTVYHNSFYMDWIREHDGGSKLPTARKTQKESSDAKIKQGAPKEKALIEINGQTIYPWEYHGEPIVRNAEMEKCLSRAARDLVKECAKQTPDYQLQISLQELWNENPGCKRSGNPVFPIYVYAEPVFHAAQGSKKAKAQQKKELQAFIQSYFHASETDEVIPENAETDEAETDERPVPQLDLTALIDCISSGFQELVDSRKAQANDSKLLYEEIRQQNVLLAQAVTLLSKDIVAQGKVLEQIQKSIGKMQYVIKPIDPDSVTTATAKILNNGKKISEEEKHSVIAEKLRNNQVATPTDARSESKAVESAISMNSNEKQQEASIASQPNEQSEPAEIEMAPWTEPVPEFINFRTYNSQIHALLAEFGYTDKMEAERRALLSQAYTRMRNNYGIVWEQLEKDYVQENGDKARSTLRLAYFLEASTPKCRGLLQSCLRTVLETEKNVKQGSKTDDAEQYHIKDLDDVDGVIEHMAAVKNVEPRALRDEYHAMLQSDSTMHWKRLSTAYREKFGMASKYVLDPMKIAKSTDKAKKRAIVLFNNFVDKQMGQDATA